MDRASGLGGGLILVLVAVAWVRGEGLAERNHGLGFGVWTDDSKLRVKVQAVQNHGFGSRVQGLGCGIMD